MRTHQFPRHCAVRLHLCLVAAIAFLAVPPLYLTAGADPARSLESQAKPRNAARAHASPTATDTLDRTVLPIPEPPIVPITELDAETNVSPDYKANNNSFTGKVIRVTAEQK